jgi:choline dehydrogenase-like flavoprotein
MPTSQAPQSTDFSRDVIGRYVCNGLDEAKRSADRTATRPDGRPQTEARDFDVIVIGGGTFGAVLAEHLCFRDTARRHRVLVLEGGPVVLPEHVQNLPMLGLNVAPATSIHDLKARGRFGPDKPQDEVWGLPWHSSHRFPGLAYCVGGRSLYWGGWSPELLAAEMPSGAWPHAVVNDLTATSLASGSPGYFQQASGQIGVTETNDFIFGDLHRALRAQLLAAINGGSVTDAVPLGSLPDHPAVRFAATAPSAVELGALLGLPPGAPAPSPAAARDELKLEAPLAVQGNTGHAGFFPFNKFSTVPLLTKAAREAYRESTGQDGVGDDARKRLMIVPRCHVIRLQTVQDGADVRVTRVDTNQGSVDVPVHGTVIIALGTIESTRLVLDSFRALPPAAYGRIGTNLMAHLRSNLDIRVPRSALAALPATATALQASALFVKGRHTFAGSSDVGHFHLQITASGLGARGGTSETELFKKIPDIDTYEAHRSANDSHVVITIRGIGEMQPQNPGSRVALDPGAQERDEFGVQRVLVSIADPRDPAVRSSNPKAALDFELWTAMDQAAKDVAVAFGVASPPDPVRDGLGTTHHETGTLFMGEEASTSVTLPDGRLRHTSNAFVVGPALFPTIGSPNPMLTGVALARRLGDTLAAPSRVPAEPGFDGLFSGFDTSLWRMTTIRHQPSRENAGSMRVIDGTLETVAGTDMGIFWCTRPTPANYVLRLQWMRLTDDSNSGVYLRFPDPDTKGYSNTAFVADDFGFEVQIDELGAPDGAGIHRTGAVYRKDNRTDHETLTQQAARAVGEWNDYEIRVDGQHYAVALNGNQVCVFDNTGLYAGRGLPSTAAAPSFVGLQVYANPRYFVRYRNVRIKALP